ncbi:unnamed protein product, partial [Polarella glacialis]
TAAKRLAEKVAIELKAERQKADRLTAQVRKLEEEKRALGTRLTAASRGPSAERSRVASRTPSAERSRPQSRPPSRPQSGNRTPPVRPQSG